MVSSLVWCPSERWVHHTHLFVCDLSFLHFSASVILRLSSSFSCFSSAALPLLIVVLWHQFGVCLSGGGPSPPRRVVPPTQRQDTVNKTKQCIYISGSSSCVCCSAHRPPLAYECCRVKSKSLSRLLLCSLLQTSSSPRLSFRPSSSSGLFWVLWGCGEHKQIFIVLEICIHKKELGIFFSVGSLGDSQRGRQWASWRCPDSDAEGHCWYPSPPPPLADLRVRGQTADCMLVESGEKRARHLFLLFYWSVIMLMYLFPLDSYPQSAGEALVETVWFHC